MYESQFTKSKTCPHCGEYNFRDEIVDDCCHECHRSFNCESCDEPLDNCDMCPECGMIQK
jgi:hypothetical protein